MTDLGVEMLFRTFCVASGFAISSCASVPPSTFEPIPFNISENAPEQKLGTIWVGPGVFIRSINGKKPPIHAKGTNAQSSALSLVLPEGQYSFKLYKTGYASVDGPRDVTLDLYIVAGHNYLARTVTEGDFETLKTIDFGFGSTCSGEFEQSAVWAYEHFVTCKRASDNL